MIRSMISGTAQGGKGPPTWDTPVYLVGRLPAMLPTQQRALHGQVKRLE